MTDTRKYIIDCILKGWFLRSWKNSNGTSCYRLYDEKGNPKENIRKATIKKLDQYIDPKIKIWKTDKSGKITLNLASVRQLHGRNYIKTAYQKLKANK